MGRTNLILDNLISEGRSKPFIVVMETSAATKPGETPPQPPRAKPSGKGQAAQGKQPAARPRFRFSFDTYVELMINDLIPFIDDNFRTLSDQGSRAMAGLSMGGMQTLNVAMSHLGKFSYIGVFSSGVFGMAPQKAKPGAEPSPKAAPSVSWEEEHQATLNDAGLKKDLKLLWFATGADDFLVDTTRTTVEMLKKHGFSPVYKETGGGHTWINWREYLNEFAPQLFQ